VLRQASLAMAIERVHFRRLGAMRPLPSELTPTVRVTSFEQFAALGDDNANVALGAALIARDVYPSLDVHALLSRMADLAAPLCKHQIAELSPAEQALALATHLSECVGFRGNEQEYYDPRNSLLPDVLDRKLGIPISLCIVYGEVARHAGVVARGVNFPGHFLLRVDARDADSHPVFVDPFFGGRSLDHDELEKLLARRCPGEKLDHDKHLRPTDGRTTLVRMLINLKWIYASRGDFARALLALDRIISLTPDSSAALRERGLLALRLGAVEAARADLSRLLELVPQAPDASSIRDRLNELRAKASVLN
jgi:regulator of sirC expression with transglutaminase-like and TPR domain